MWLLDAMIIPQKFSSQHGRRIAKALVLITNLALFSRQLVLPALFSHGTAEVLRLGTLMSLCCRHCQLYFSSGVRACISEE